MIGKMKRKKNIELVYVEYRWNPTAGLSSKFHWQINTTIIINFLLLYQFAMNFFSQPCYTL